LANIACFIFYLCIILFSVGGDLSKLAFLTPGLWNVQEGILVRILFELPFVLLRMTPLVFFMTVIVFYGYWGSKAKKNYEAVMNEDTDKE